MNRTAKLIQNTAILAIGTILTKVISFLMAPLFSRWMSTSDYGTFDLYLTYIILLVPLFTLSIGEALFRKLIDSDLTAGKTYISSGLALYFCGLICTLGVLFFFFRNITSFIPFVFLLTAQSLYDLLMYILRGQKKLKQYTVYGAMYSIFMAFFSCLFILVFEMGLTGLLLGYAASYLLVSLVIIFNGHLCNSFSIHSFSFSSLKELLRYSIPLIPNSVSWWIVNVCDRTIIANILGAAFNGVYAIATKIPAICTSLFSVFHLSWQQSASEEVGSSDYSYYVKNVFNNIVKILTSVCIVVMATNFLFFYIFFDERYFAGYYQSPILIVAILISFLTQFLGGVFISYEETKVNGITTFIGAVLDVIINLLFLKTIGLYAASISTLVSYFVIFIIRWILLNRKVKISIEKSNIIYILILTYFFVTQYINNLLLNIINLISAIVIFGFINRSFAKAIFARVTKRKK